MGAELPHVAVQTVSFLREGHHPLIPRGACLVKSVPPQVPSPRSPVAILQELEEDISLFLGRAEQILPAAPRRVGRGAGG